MQRIVDKHTTKNYGRMVLYKVSFPEIGPDKEWYSIYYSDYPGNIRYLFSHLPKEEAREIMGAFKENPEYTVDDLHEGFIFEEGVSISGSRVEADITASPYASFEPHAKGYCKEGYLWWSTKRPKLTSHIAQHELAHFKFGHEKVRQEAAVRDVSKSGSYTKELFEQEVEADRESKRILSGEGKWTPGLQKAVRKHLTSIADLTGQEYKKGMV